MANNKNDVQQEREKNIIPKMFEKSAMRQFYEFKNYDEHSGIWSPSPAGEFWVTRPHASFACPVWFNMACDPFPMLEEATMDKGDILLVTPPKTGTHLTHEILTMLRNGNAAYSSKTKSDEWIDIMPYDKILESQPDKPRVIASHLPLAKIPPNFRRPDTKVVVTMRNFKDTFVSFFHHFIGMKKTFTGVEPNPHEDWPEYFNYFMESKLVTFGNHFDTYADLWDNHRDDPNVLIVFFEDIIRKPKETVQRMADHIGVSYTPKLIDDIAQAIDMKNMKAGKHETEGFLRQMFGDQFSIYRKGEIGNWREWFTADQNEAFQMKFEEWNRERKVPMIFE